MEGADKRFGVFSGLLLTVLDCSFHPVWTHIQAFRHPEVCCCMLLNVLLQLPVMEDSTTPSPLRGRDPVDE